MEVRRIYESKLLRHAYDTLLVTETKDKEVIRDKVWKIALGMVVLNIEDELAWIIALDWRDFEFMGRSLVFFFFLKFSEMYGKQFLRDLVKTIPQSGLAKVISAYLESSLSNFPPDSLMEKDEGEADDKVESDELPSEDVLDELIVFIFRNRNPLTSRKVTI
jgi:hypothetical protein